MTIEKAPRAPRRTARIVRWTVLGAVLALVAVFSVLHQKLGVGKPVGVDALCPFGGLETLGTLVTSATLVQKVAASSVALLVASVVVALVFRRAFCGRICPLGFLQELFGGLGHKLFRTRLTVPKVIDRPARYLKYAVLAVILFFTWQGASLVVRPYDPWVAFNHLTSAELFAEYGIGVAILGVTLVGSLLYDRFFCKYACPMGAFLGLISRVSVFKLRRNADTCIDCKACDKACPVNLTVSEIDTMKSPECIDCGECVSACPVKDTLGVSAPSSARLSPVAAAALATGTFALVVAGATLTGNFDWTMPTLSDAVAETAPAAGDTASTPTTSGTVAFDTSLIKGSTTLREVIDVSGIPAEVFTQVYGVPANKAGGQLKDLKNDYGCSPGDVRAFIEAYAQDPSVAETWVVGTVEETEGH